MIILFRECLNEISIIMTEFYKFPCFLGFFMAKRNCTTRNFIKNYRKKQTKIIFCMFLNYHDILIELPLLIIIYPSSSAGVSNNL